MYIKDKIIRRISIILGFLFILIVPIIGQNLSVQSSINKSEMPTGQQANITLNIRTDNLPHTSYSISKTDEPYKFRILSYTPTDTIDIDKKIKEFKVNVLITSFDSTLITIPAFVVSNGVDSVYSKPLTLKINQPKVDISKPDSISPIKDVWSVGLGFKDYMYIIFHSWIFYIIVALLLIAVVVIYLYKRSLRPKEEKPVFVAEKKLSPIEKAHRDFDILDKTDYLLKGDYKSYYTECFDIVRRYIEERRGWEVLEMTSFEIVETFKKDKYAKVLSPALKELTNNCDFVKFAKFTPSKDEAYSFRNEAFVWVDDAEKVFSSSFKNDEQKDEEVLK